MPHSVEMNLAQIVDYNRVLTGLNGAMLSAERLGAVLDEGIMQDITEKSGEWLRYLNKVRPEMTHEDEELR